MQTFKTVCKGIIQLNKLNALKRLKISQMKTQISHYKIHGQIFIDYMDAYEYCIQNKIDANKIIKTIKH